MPNAASRRSQRKAKERALRDQEGERTVITQIMSSPVGRRWAWLQLERAQIFQDDAESADPLAVKYRSGRRSEGLYLLRSITRWTPNHYITMTRENTGADIEAPGEEDQQDEHSTISAGPYCGPPSSAPWMAMVKALAVGLWPVWPKLPPFHRRPRLSRPRPPPKSSTRIPALRPRLSSLPRPARPQVPLHPSSRLSNLLKAPNSPSPRWREPPKEGERSPSNRLRLDPGVLRGSQASRELRGPT